MLPFIRTKQNPLFFMSPVVFPLVKYSRFAMFLMYHLAALILKHTLAIKFTSGNTIHRSHAFASCSSMPANTITKPGTCFETTSSSSAIIFGVFITALGEPASWSTTSFALPPSLTAGCNIHFLLYHGSFLYLGNDISCVDTSIRI